MKKNLRSTISILMIFAMMLTVTVALSGCELLSLLGIKSSTINGIAVKEYAIVYSESAPDYNKNAAYYIQNAIYEAIGVELNVITDTDVPADHEIIVGETARNLSRKLNAETEGLEFAILANDVSIALEGDYFVIAAAAYYFVNTYISEGEFNAEIPQEVTINTPIVEAPNNYIFLIGDGMGEYQTKIFDYIDSLPENMTTDGEDIFYGYLFPYMGWSMTRSLDGVTDSGAGGTALACGYKTLNGLIGKDKDYNDIMSLTELADSLEMATAVMSTEPTTGATPASFSAHCIDRDLSSVIILSQKELENTIIKSATDTYIDSTSSGIISNILNELSEDEDGFFLMYEESHIDKKCHNNDFEYLLRTMLRFNQAIGMFMEFAFYNPDTFVLITADHETGQLYPGADGELIFNSTNHSGDNVQVFVYGLGAEIFDGVVMQNAEIPITIAKMWGVDDFGDIASGFQALQEK